jgi:hypothetical protein
LDIGGAFTQLVQAEPTNVIPVQLAVHRQPSWSFASTIRETVSWPM